MEKPRIVKVGGADGAELNCLVCGYNEFVTRTAQLDTAAMSLLGLDWANRSAVCHVCDRWVHVHWFIPRG